MKKTSYSRICLLLFLIFALSLTACSQPPAVSPGAPSFSDSTGAYPLTITNYDSNEQPVTYTYKKVPRRVIITHPGATELLLDLGLGDHILSTIAPYGAPLDRLAEKYAKLSILKAKYTPTQEELLEMQPDMLIGWVHNFRSTEMGDVKYWNERGVGTFILPSTLTGNKPVLERVVYDFIADIGRVFNIQEETASYIQNLKSRVAKVEAATRDISQKKTVIVLQDHFNGTFSIYDSHYLITHMIDIAGGINLCQDPASFVGAEKVLSFDPDFIIIVSYNKDDATKDLSDEEAQNALRRITQLQSMRAIQKGNILSLPFFTVNSGGIRTVDAIEKISRTLYPERYL